MVAPYQKIKNFLRCTPWAGCTGLQKVANKFAHFLAQIAKLTQGKMRGSFLRKKSKKIRCICTVYPASYLATTFFSTACNCGLTSPVSCLISSALIRGGNVSGAYRPVATSFV